MLNNRLINQLFRNRKKSCKKLRIKNWATELPIFEKNVKKLSKTIKYTKSIDTMIKNFDNIGQEFEYIQQYKPHDIDLELNGQVINNIGDIEIIKEQYIKDFINNRINIELQKKNEITQIFLQESLIKRALTIALKSIEYLPKDVEMRLRITELEQELMNCYGGNKNE